MNMKRKGKQIYRPLKYVNVIERNRDVQEWYEDEVNEIEKSFTEHLERCEKELEVSNNVHLFIHPFHVNLMEQEYRSSCFAKAEKKEEELEKELKSTKKNG